MNKALLPNGDGIKIENCRIHCTYIFDIEGSADRMAVDIRRALALG